MKCLKCNSILKESPFNKTTGYKSFRCTNKDCNALFDKKDLELHKKTGTHACGIVVAGEKVKEIKPTLLGLGQRSKNINMQQAMSRVYSKGQSKKFKINDIELNKYLNGGFEGGRIYSFIESPANYGQLSHFLLKNILKNQNSDYIIVDPLNIIENINKKYNTNFKSYNAKSIEDAYSKIIDEGKNGKLILCLNTDALVSEDLIKDPHRKVVVGYNSLLHNKYLKVLSSSLSENSSILFFSIAIPNPRPIGGVVTHFNSNMEILAYESFIISKTSLKVTVSNRKSLRSSRSIIELKERYN